MSYENFLKAFKLKREAQEAYHLFSECGFYCPFKFDSYCTFLLASQKVLWKK